ncbi:MAG: type III toxin-antitoxin system ToxN/AbiQ family toxin [Mollicutes bacterium]|nr:type III toxin-antitoxin system ToxN/AbiQ family toxin [Mollicutes bacterium]
MNIHLFAVSDEYISRISTIDHRVLSNHENDRKHNRPYIGFLVFIEPFHYFLPLSSADKRDYDENGKLRPSTQTILRMVRGNGTFMGKILLNNMIPVPLTQVKRIPLNQFNDSLSVEERFYQNLLVNESLWIDEHKAYIVNQSNWVYHAKICEFNRAYWSGRKIPGFLKATVDFKKVEKFMVQNYGGETLIEENELQSFVLK